MSVNMHLLGVALAAVLGSGACAPLTQSAAGPETRATLLVENNNWADMNVFLVRDGMRTRVGSVPSLSRSLFVLSDAMVGGAGELRLLADPIGSSQVFVSQPIHVQPGQQVRFRLENNVQLSSYSVF
jgi:hypothetical protein